MVGTWLTWAGLISEVPVQGLKQPGANYNEGRPNKGWSLSYGGWGDNGTQMPALWRLGRQQTQDIVGSRAVSARTARSRAMKGGEPGGMAGGHTETCLRWPSGGAGAVCRGARPNWQSSYTVSTHSAKQA